LVQKYGRLVNEEISLDKLKFHTVKSVLCCVSALVSMRIRIQGAKSMRIDADPDPDPGQTLKSRKVEYYMQNILKKEGYRSRNIPTKVQNPFCKAGNQVYLLFLSISMLLDTD
jgi:hypothetical protein